MAHLHAKGADGTFAEAVRTADPNVLTKMVHQLPAKMNEIFRQKGKRNWRIFMTPPDPLQNRSGIFQIHSDTAPKRSTSNTNHDSSKSMYDRRIDCTYS